MDFRLLRPFNKEEFYQNVLGSFFDELGNYTIQFEKTVNINRHDLKKNRSVLEQYGIKVESSDKFSSNGVTVELGGTRYDLLLEYKNQYEFIIEVKSNLKRVKDGHKASTQNQNQLIRYFVSYVLKFGKAPSIINLIYISNVGSDKEEEIKNEMLSILMMAERFCEKAETRISGIALFLQDNVSELTMQTLKDNTFYTNGKSGRF